MYMLNKSNLTDLILSIAAQGYFPGEPLLVKPCEDKLGKFEVLEGNRRLAALKLLLHPDLAPTKRESIMQIVASAKYRPESVPVLVYETKNEVLEYLGYRHITGVQQWDSLQKARYLAQLRNIKSDLDYKTVTKELAKLIGSRADYVQKLLSGYKIYQLIEENNFFKIPNLNEDNFKFSLLTTALSYSNINEYVVVPAEEDEIAEEASVRLDHLKDLTEWIYKENEGRTRLGESRNLSTLNAVVNVPEALHAFKAGGRTLDEARLFTDEPQKIFSHSIRQALISLSDAKSQSHHVPKPVSTDLDDLKDLIQIARELHMVVRTKIDERDLDL